MQSGRDWDNDTILAFIVGSVIAVTALGSAGIYWAEILTWLTRQGVLVPAEEAPLVALPGGAGQGLDASRLAIFTGAALLLAALATGAIHGRARGRR